MATNLQTGMLFAFFGFRQIVFVEICMSQDFRKATSLIAVLCAICMVGVMTFGWIMSVSILHGSSQRAEQNTLATSADIDTTWRHTKFGWQDSSSWPTADSFTPPRTLELLHPFVWAGIVLITVIATMIWASSEWEFSRLFEKRDDADA